MSEAAGRTHRCLVLSDLHLRSADIDERYATFLKVLEKFSESGYDELILMGDIFDILIGPYKFWQKLHPHFFSVLKKIAAAGKQVVWVQGNHDFQLGSLLKNYGINWVEQDEILVRNSRRIFLSHGDLANWSAKLHPLWRKFLTSKLMSFALWLIPEGFGEKVLYPMTLKASSASRRASKPQVDDRGRDLFRKYALAMAKKHGADLVILGHSHIEDNTALDSTGSHYFNVGSWFAENPVGEIEISPEGKLTTKVFPAQTWLSSM